jgi:hypothetical protein
MVFENLLEETRSLNKKMEQAIIKVVKENGGLVRTDNPDYRYMDICCYVFNDYNGHYEEKKILALTTLKDDGLYILFGEDYEILGDMTNDEILESSEWCYITDDLIFIPPTLLCICELLEEHLD